MEWKVTKKNKTLILVISGEIDHHTSEFLREKADELLGQMGGKNIVFHLGEVAFMDSSGIGMLIGRYKRTESLGGRIAILCASEKMKEIIRISGLSNLLKTFETLEEALEYTEGRDS